MNNCSNCGEVINSSFQFCPNCGTKIILEKTAPDKKNSSELVKCDVCGEETTTVSGYCESCGAGLSGEEKIISGEYQKPVVSSTLNKAAKPQGSVAKKNITKASKITADEKKNISNTLSNKQILLLVVAVLITGFLILEISGVFDNNDSQSVQVPAENNTQVQSPAVDLAALERINNLENTVKQDTTNSVNILELAHSLNDAGFFDRAIEYYKMYLRRNPKNADVLVDLGVCYFEMKKYDDAKLYMNKGLAINPQHQIAHFNLGIVNLSAGSIDSAKYWWNKAVAINPASEIGKRAKELLESH